MGGLPFSLTLSGVLVALDELKDAEGQDRSDIWIASRGAIRAGVATFVGSLAATGAAGLTTSLILGGTAVAGTFAFGPVIVGAIAGGIVALLTEFNHESI